MNSNMNDLYLQDEKQMLKEHKIDMEKLEKIKEAKMLDELTYRSYFYQRHLYGVSYELCSKFFDNALCYEIKYLEEISRLNQNSDKLYKGRFNLQTQEVSL